MIHLDNEALLTQLGYSVNKSTKAQMEAIIKNTRGFEHIERHIIPFNDSLKPHQAYVALSNSKDYFKIKSEAISPEIIEEVKEMIKKWAEKFKIELEKVDGKDTYYIIGFK